MNIPLTRGEHSVQRSLVHQRRVTCSGYSRTDGLWDVEGHLIDTATYESNLATGTAPPGAPIHEMTIRLTVDVDLHIIDAAASTLHSPYLVCGEISTAYKELIGLQIQPGFTAMVKNRFRRHQGCSHLTEMLPSVATEAFQLLMPVWSRMGRPFVMVDSCHALRADGEVVKEHFPLQYKPRLHEPVR
ncbi:MAG: DUF2889 domain-containing protein [Betaproteobacteria bacterium]